MKNPVDSFAAALRAARAKRHLTQRALADNLHMSVRTIIEIELGRSNPRFETVALLAKEMNISLDAIVFPDAGRQMHLRLTRKKATVRNIRQPPFACMELYFTLLFC